MTNLLVMSCVVHGVFGQANNPVPGEAAGAVSAAVDHEAELLSALKELPARYADAARRHRKALQQERDRRRRAALARQDPATEFGRELLKTSQQCPDCAAACEALLWICRNCRRDRDRINQAIGLLVAHHAHRAELAEVLEMRTVEGLANSEGLFRAVLENDQLPSVRGVACYRLGKHLARRFRGGDDSTDQPEHIALLERVRREFPNVPHYGRPLGQWATAELFDLRRERPGGADGPPIRFLSPGFVARELPVKLENVNNVRYRRDGKLMALVYSGRIVLLSDSDGDGLEDQVETFWDAGSLQAPLGMAFTPPGYSLGDGVFVASKGKLSLIVDTDGDDRADREHVVASGWEEIKYVVDALGVALDEDGSIYFGLGCANYENPYLLDAAAGTAGYRLSSERGTILKVSPDFRQREVVCTGIRFPVGLAFNRHGDLFCTDQEGEAWLRGANPLDELLWIRPGRHYGFPPKHDQWLPDVVDEPALHQYGPQHQVTCGLVFNESDSDRPHFGPDHWDGDALIAGFVRGKIYRTKLVRTPAGYLAANAQIAALGMLTVDMTVSPDGGLVVACHGGKPSWGSGPTGAGRLFKVEYSSREVPQPVVAWPAGPLETCVAFDRPLAPEDIDHVVDAAEITCGEYVRAGDRFEVLPEAYREMTEQRRAPRWTLDVVGAALSADRRTLRLRTAAHSRLARYAVRVDAIEDAAVPFGPIDIDYTLHGVDAIWEPDEESALDRWANWLPHLDPDASLAILNGSEQGDQLAHRLSEPGRLTMRTRLTMPAGEWHLKMESSAVLDVRMENHITVGPKSVSLQTKSTGRPLPLEISIRTGAPQDDGDWLRLSYCSDNDPTRRAVPLQRLLVPWSPDLATKPASSPSMSPPFAKGDWHRGKQIFLKDGRCADCHRVRGVGKNIGPDLSHLVIRDPVSVERDIREPSAVINPNHVSYTLMLSSGRVLHGTIPFAGPDQIRLLDNTGRQTVVRRSEIEEFHASPISAMPKGLDILIGRDGMNDLLTFLLTPQEPAVSVESGTATSQLGGRLTD